VTALRDHHATIFLPGAVAEPIEAVRRVWDPAMAAQIAAHVTLVYPQEAPEAGPLAERLGAVCAGTGRFRLRLGALAYFDRPDDGVYVGVQDGDGACRRIREAVLRPPFRQLSFPLHVTLIHPRTSARGREFWEHGQHHLPVTEFPVDDVAITAFDGAKWVVLERFALAGG
jgi:hypothetical protein